MADSDNNKILQIVDLVCSRQRHSSIAVYEGPKDLGRTLTRGVFRCEMLPLAVIEGCSPYLLSTSGIREYNVSLLGATPLTRNFPAEFWDVRAHL